MIVDDFALGNIECSNAASTVTLQLHLFARRVWYTNESHIDGVATMKGRCTFKPLAEKT